MAEAERALVLERFRHSSIRWSQNSIGQSSDSSKKSEQVEQKPHMIVVTDTCLPILAYGEAAICARVLINYELPTKKVIEYVPQWFVYFDNNEIVEL